MIGSNYGDEGGGLFGTNDASLHFINSTFKENVAGIVGGAMMLYNRASIRIDGGLFWMNSADRALVMAGFNDDGLARYVFSNDVEIVSAYGTMMIAASSWEGLKGGSVRWRCAHKGSSLVEDGSSHKFYSMQCVLCKDGSYGVGDAREVVDGGCRICPYGAYCGTPEVDVEGIQALSGFWGRIRSSSSATSTSNDSISSPAISTTTTSTSSTIEMMVCPSGFCCPMGRNCTIEDEKACCGIRNVLFQNQNERKDRWKRET